jgi:uncharacterized protein (TIGR03435 family)
MGQRKRDGIEVQGATMADFCMSLSNIPLRLDRRRFVDKTGISGHFDFDLKFPDDTGLPLESGGPPIQMDDLSRLQSALRKVGLQLTAAKGADDAVVIDHAERPTAN